MLCALAVWLLSVYSSCGTATAEGYGSTGESGADLQVTHPLPGAGYEIPAVFRSELPAAALAEELMDRMSDEEIAGQLFLLGYAGSVPSRDILDWISTRNIGGVKIFGWNAENLDRLAAGIALMQERALGTPTGIPLFVATDQEGGWVRHIKGETTETPGNLALGASGLPYDAFYTGFYIGRELRALGINMNFAPTIDVYTNPNAVVIGPRSFSEDPVLTGTLAVAFMKGMERAGVIATAKHFPGHGNANEDSHGTLPLIQDSLETVWERDLLPYRYLIREGLPAVMSGHLAFPRITGDPTPASLTGFFMTEILRNRMGFEGIAMTDDLYMYGARAEGLTMADICVKAIEAGNDLIMLSRTPSLNDSIWRQVIDRYRENPGFRTTVRAAARRILTAKITYFRSENAVPVVPSREDVPNHIPDKDGAGFFFDQACRSVTVIRDARIPYIPRENERVLVVSSLPDFLEESKTYLPGADRFSYPYGIRAEDRLRLADHRERLGRLAGSYDTILFCLVNEYGIELLKVLKPHAGKVIVFSLLSPIHLRSTPWVESALAVYGWSIDTYRAGFAVLRGDFSPRGILPVRVFDGD